MAEAGAGSSSGIPPDGDSMTMLDVLREEEDLDEDADAVLGNTDDKHCSYSQNNSNPSSFQKLNRGDPSDSSGSPDYRGGSAPSILPWVSFYGYVRRQPLYSCLTCAGKDLPAGVCLACSYHCHEGHELIELYTKRNFRCDCGGSQQPGLTCRLAAKTGNNPKNKYNQNYGGLYCTCHRPYPDPDDDTPDQMVQCIVCEDWFHGRHLHAPVPEDGEFTEMTCSDCVARHPYLGQYSADPEMASNVKAEGQDSTSREKVTSTECKLKGRKQPNATGSLFWKSGWRQHICACETCQAMYRKDGVEFLLDEEDSVAAYEERGRGGTGSYAQGMRALSSMERVQQVEVVSEYNDLKSELMNYLQKFADNKKVVRKEDIQEFFSGMKSRKRQKTEMSHFCR